VNEMNTIIIGLTLWVCSVAACFAQDSWNVSLVGFYNTPGIASGVAVAGNYAYVADREGGLLVIDITTPATPTVAGFYLTPEYACDVAVAGNYAYVADNYSGLRVIDITNPAAPAELGFCDTPGGAVGVAVAGNYAYVADGDGGLRLINITNPVSPTESGFYDTPGYACDVAVAGNYAYVADFTYGLRVIDITNPSAPTQVGFYSTPGGYANGVAVSGNYAYAAGFISGLRVIDISNPTAPTEVGFFSGPGYAYGVVVEGDYAYVAEYYSLRVVNISNPAAPTEVGFYLVPGLAVGVAAAGNYAYVADANGGLGIYDCSAATGNILPVELLSFEAVPGDRQVTLHWTTASETDNDYFDIERDGAVMDRVEATNSATGCTYNWSESNLINGREYTYSLVSVSESGEREVIGTASATPTMNAATITEYALHQNYPNPFNPETNITFDIVEAGEVTLTVFNSTGQTVATLVNGAMTSGRHSVTFDASTLPSGLYFYRLNTANFTSVKKMVLMK
jgi:hypothetical protein